MDRKHLNALRFHLERLAAAHGDDLEHHWTKALAATTELLREPPSAELAPLQRHLLQFQECAPGRYLPPNFALLVRLLDQVAAKHAGSASKSPSIETPVQEVARLLRGRALLVIGGLSRPQHAESLRDALGLSEVVWPHTRENDASVAAFEPYIARPDVAVVLLLIRWIRHAHGDVLALCERHGKPLVRIPGGYNAEQVAPLILEQSGRRIRGEA